VTPEEIASAKLTRRIMREGRRAAKIPDRSAQCGIAYYSQSPAQRESGSYWKECHRCKKLLDYQPVAVRRECVP
jgi:hypothetical protein